MNNKGSSTVMLIMFFAGMIILITALITVSEEKAVRGECEALSFLWGKAIISEYDRYLYNDYGIMAFYGHERETDDKLTKYCKKTFDKQNSTELEGVTVDLSSYKLSSLNNFSKSISLAEVKDIKDRSKRENCESEIVIRNPYVKDTLISEYTEEDYSIGKLKRMISKGYDYEDITASCSELIYILNRFDNHLYIRNGGETVLKNEWEYMICGKKDDDKNFVSAKRRIWLLRNVLNLGYLYSDTDKRQMTLSIAEIITPGPWAFAVQAAIMESWSIIESNHDINELLDCKKIPLMKTDDSWHTDIDSVLDSDELSDKLTEEELASKNSNRNELKDLEKDEIKGVDELSGLDYEEYLLLFIAVMSEETRLSRMMDLLQMNMKLRYYRDFNMFEYNVGADFIIKVNGKEYESNVCYNR